ncbi:MAG TPA: NAD(P)(+) transhydrogenase (Re/Si-specific) subunit beta, partial [Gaiellaceae bacterium]|nr:NAD(P)(+) transhydrogenase (Re/Si-specific) subunit beta [Gaiellaceae bacterium]
MSRTWIDAAYLVAAICLIVGIKRLSHPSTARSGNWIGAIGMLLAVAATFAIDELDSYWLIVVGIAIGTVFGIASAR